MITKKIEKLNIINIAKHHKKICTDKSCSISLYLLLIVAENSGLEFTKKEKEIFL